MADLTQLVPPNDLSNTDRQAIFSHFFCSLAAFRNTAFLHADQEHALSPLPTGYKFALRDQAKEQVQTWAQKLLEQAYIVCGEPSGGALHFQQARIALTIQQDKCPKLGLYVDTSTDNLSPLPAPDIVTRVLNTVVFLHIASSKEFSARTRAFLSAFGSWNEDIIVAALRNPSRAIEETQKQTQDAKESHAKVGKMWRMAGIGLGAVAGGVVIPLLLHLGT